MTVPPSYTTITEYFTDALSFLQTYSWIYREANTRYIKSNILVEIPKSWIEHISLLSIEEFNQLPFGFIKPDWPDDLKQFFLKIEQLKPIYSNDEKLEYDKKNNIKGINPKKLHEINNLSKIILEIGKTQNVKHFIDVGCGLGYLTQFLYENNDQIKIYGIESDGDRVKTAKKRQEKYFKNSIGSIHFIEHFVDNMSKYYIEQIIEEADEENFGLIGMHACGDLTISSIKLFHQIRNIKVIIIMPCCYHKMAIENDNTFTNIPLSKSLKTELAKINKQLIINRPFLRLASQQSASKWKLQSQEEHDVHSRNMFQRAVIECALTDSEKVIQINKTPISGVTTFESISQRYRIINEKNVTVSWNITHRDKINSVLQNYSDGVIQSEILTCFQTCLQSICENIVLLDKVCYTNEIVTEFSSLNIEFYTKKIVCEALSPRCYAFIGIKNN